jgi:hypothetical protein
MFDATRAGSSDSARQALYACLVLRISLHSQPLIGFRAILPVHSSDPGQPNRAHTRAFKGEMQVQ